MLTHREIRSIQVGLHAVKPCNGAYCRGKLRPIQNFYVPDAYMYRGYKLCAKCTNAQRRQNRYKNIRGSTEL